tara:strand:+ start:886 stop:1515 length:630 start_codon:yes stop_codon:yes gene_type:complete
MIIGICGLIGSGKGTVADVLVDQGFTKVSFADKLKDGVATIFGWDRTMLEGDTDESRNWREEEDVFWTEETGRTITPRIVLQEFGTECMREGFDNGIWVSLLKKHMLDNPGNYVVPDVRFRNEQNMIRDLGGEIWQVKRGKDPEWFERAIFDNNNPATSNLMSGIDVHESEYKWIDVNTRFDQILLNNSTLEHFTTEVLHTINSSTWKK